MSLRSTPKGFSQSAEDLDGDLKVVIREILIHGIIDTAFQACRQLWKPIRYAIGSVPLAGYNAHLVLS